MKGLRSPTKFRVLSLISAKGGLETRDLARELRIRVTHAGKLLRTYREQGLLAREERTMEQGGTRYLYSLTRAGMRRLAYFQRRTA